MTGTPLQVVSRVRDVLQPRPGSTSAQILQGASSAAALRIFNTIATFLIAVLLARMLGVEDFGIYSYAISWVTLLGVFARLGVDQIMIANIAVYQLENDWARIRGILRFAILAVSTASLICVLGAAALAWFVHQHESAIREALLLACLLLPLQAMLVPFGATQHGLRQVTYAHLPSLFVTPSLFLVLLVVSHFFAPSSTSVIRTIALQILAVTASLIFSIDLFRKGLRNAGRPSVWPAPIYQARAWFVSSMPVVLMGSMFMINGNADILMLGSIDGPAAAGVYKAATRGGELLTFGLSAICVPLGPIIARLYSAGEQRDLQKELRLWAIVGFIPAAILAGFFIIAGDWFLALFGAEFAGGDATIALRILCAGQLVHAAAGPVGLLLIMTGHRNTTAWVLTLAAAVNVVLNAVFIPVWGVAGAAVATASSTAIFALLLVKYAIQKTRLNPTVFPSIKRPKMRTKDR